jgi:pyruvate/2-oxoglutarate dehydrogenase complex dihydrolipoamide dehydrogenase (E3) component
VSTIKSNEKMTYLNAMATFIDRNTVICSTDPSVIKNYISTDQLPIETDKYQKIKAKYFVIATGTRPQYLDIEGASLAITSDDIFTK